MTKEIDRLYEGMDNDNRTAYVKLFASRYIELLHWLKRKLPREDDILDMAEIATLEILTTPDDVTHYTYDTEVYRKRDRLKEAVNSVSGKMKKSAEIDKALRLWSGQAQQYADTVSDAATIRAFQDAGVKRVKWVTENDQRVCPDCNKLNGKIFAIDKVPPKQHWRCRCWVTPVT